MNNDLHTHNPSNPDTIDNPISIPSTQPLKTPPQLESNHYNETRAHTSEVQHTCATTPRTLTNHSPHPFPKKLMTTPHNRTTYTHLTHALNNTDKHIKTLIQNLPENWTTNKAAGATITKSDLIPCTWGEHSDTDSTQAFQRAITTRYPPAHSRVTQYTTYITSPLTTDYLVWTQAINNAYDDNTIPRPLHNPITIFNIHHRYNFITLITNNHTYQ
jgi:hypothetical protein